MERTNKCVLCLLKDEQFVPPSGDIHSSLWIIGEAPGETEVKQKKPFVGQSGQLLRKIMIDKGYNPDNCYITNAVKCHPPCNKTPTSKNITDCSALIKQELNKGNPKVILLLGRTALSLFFPQETLFSSVRGNIIKYMLGDNRTTFIISSWHPAYILRNNSVKKELKEDVERAIDLVNGNFDISLLENNCKIISSINDLKDFTKKVISEKIPISLDIETTGLIPYKHTIIGIGIAYNLNSAVYIPLKIRDIGFLNKNSLQDFWGNDTKTAISCLIDIFNSDNKKVAHNASFEIKMIEAEFKIKLKNVVMCTQVASHLLNENRDGYNLEALQREELPYMPTYKRNISKYIKITEEESLDYSTVPLNLLADYCAKDAIVCYRLAKKFTSYFLDTPNLMNFYKKFSLPLTYCISSIERRGIFFDKNGAGELQVVLEKEKNNISQQIFKSAGYEFNIMSHNDIETLLFDKIKLKSEKMTKIGRSVDKKVLENFSKEGITICKLILDYRQVDKLLTTYLLSNQKKSALSIDRNNIIHPSFKQIGTNTGRLSCENPNLQNLPSNLGSTIKKLYKPRAENRVFIIGDYSQMELRILAYYSQDERLINACENNIDLHTQSASDIFGIPLNEVTESKRRFAKTYNFAIIYGQHFTSTARMLEISEQEAKDFQNKYFTVYNGILKFKENTISLLRKNGYIESCFGRRRHLPQIYSSNKGEVSLAERQAVNALIQGTAVDFCNYNMVKLQKFLDDNYTDAYIILQVHDSIVVECNDIDKEKIHNNFIKILEDKIDPINIKMKIDSKITLNLKG